MFTIGRHRNFDNTWNVTLLFLTAAASPTTSYASLDGLSGSGTDLAVALASCIAILVFGFWLLYKFIQIFLKSTKANGLKIVGLLLKAFLFWYVCTAFLYFIVLIAFSGTSLIEFWKIPLVVIQSLLEFPLPRSALSFFLAMITVLIRMKYRSQN